MSSLRALSTQPPPLASLPLPSPHAPPLPLQGCALWHNWWPLLTAFAYVLVPMPLLFFADAGESLWDPAVGGGAVDLGRFLVGAAATACVAIPVLLCRAGVIAAGAAVTELAAVALLGGTLAAYDALSRDGW